MAERAKLDPRLHPYRPDLAASHLKGKVEADRFVVGWLEELIVAQAPLRRAPRHDAALDTEALMGERATVYETDEEGWAWCQLENDGYVGWLPASALEHPGPPPTHKVAVPRTFGFSKADIKTPPFVSPPLGSLVAIVREQGSFAISASGLHIPASHLAPLAANQTDFVAVAERFAGTPYLWGGKTSAGIDCSGLVQVALQECGVKCPRDSDMQQAALGGRVNIDNLRRGDLVFWKGHVAIARDAATLIHANAFHMAVAIELVTNAIARIAAAGSEVMSVNRL